MLGGSPMCIAGKLSENRLAPSACWIKGFSGMKPIPTYEPPSGASGPQGGRGCPKTILVVLPSEGKMGP